MKFPENKIASSPHDARIVRKKRGSQVSPCREDPNNKKPQVPKHNKTDKGIRGNFPDDLHLPRQ
jgi:hypothetical protein